MLLRRMVASEPQTAKHDERDLRTRRIRDQIGLERMTESGQVREESIATDIVSVGGSRRIHRSFPRAPPPIGFVSPKRQKRNWQRGAPDTPHGGQLRG
eukprot:339131-Pyramimonas_sp.AAC.1